MIRIDLYEVAYALRGDLAVVDSLDNGKPLCISSGEEEKGVHDDDKRHDDAAGVEARLSTQDQY